MSKKSRIIPAIVLFFIFAVSILNAQPIAQSTFDTGNENWLVVSTEGYSGYANWSATGGNPGGGIYDTDMDGGGWAFLAPQKFRGNMSAAYGNELTYDFLSDRIENNYASVALAQPNGIGIITTVPLPANTNTWAHREVTFDLSQGWNIFDYFNDTTGGPASSAQIYAVLANLEYLVLGAEFAPGFDNDGTYTYGELVAYDNVILTPEPATIVLLGLGTSVLLRKRKISPGL